MIETIRQRLGDKAGYLEYVATGVDRTLLHLPGPDFVDRVMVPTDRPAGVLKNLSWMFGSGRLVGTGYLSILPVDQGVEHSGASSFAPNPIYFDPENIVKLAVESGCNAVASTLGVLGSVSRRYAHKIPFLVKLNHNELLSFPNSYDQTLFANVRQAFAMGAAGVGATIYFGSEGSRHQLVEISQAFAQAHELGMFTVLWCYLRNNEFKKDGVDHNVAADLSSQANHLGVTIEADIIKQKQPENDGGYGAVAFSNKPKPELMAKLVPNHPIEWTRWQVVNCYMGRAGLINSGGASGGKDDLAEAVTTAVVNKRAGGTGLIVGRKAFQKPMKDGVALIQATQDVYLESGVTVA